MSTKKVIIKPEPTVDTYYDYNECWHIDEKTPDWVKDIHKHYIEEFADEAGSLKMWVAW